MLSGHNEFKSESTFLKSIVKSSWVVRTNCLCRIDKDSLDWPKGVLAMVLRAFNFLMALPVIFLACLEKDMRVS